MGRKSNTFESVIQKIIKQDDGCWIWPGAKTTNGHGIVGFRGSSILVHRLIYNHMVESAMGKVVRHKCDNPACCNPDHLELGTQLDNIKDREDRGRNHNSNKTHCHRGHALSGMNLVIDKNNKRVCKMCEQIRNVERKMKPKIKFQNETK